MGKRKEVEGGGGGGGEGWVYEEGAAGVAKEADDGSQWRLHQRWIGPSIGEGGGGGGEEEEGREEEEEEEERTALHLSSMVKSAERNDWRRSEIA